MTEATAAASADARGADTSKLYASRECICDSNPEVPRISRVFSCASIHVARLTARTLLPRAYNISLSYLPLFLFISHFLSLPRFF